MKNFLKKILCISLINFAFFKTDKIQSIVPYYYFPNANNLQNESLNIGKNAYQLLYFGNYEESLNLAKLAVKINAKDEKLWLILSEAQLANKLYLEALDSLRNAENINSNISEIYFAKSKVYLHISQQKNAKIALQKGLSIEPNNHNAIFKLGNIALMEENFTDAIKLFDKSIKIKPDFWPAINNKGLAYFEKNNLNLSIKMFEEAISLQDNPEPLLGLASCLRIKNIELAIKLAKKALAKDANYVSSEYRKEQLWGDKIQASTEILLQNKELQEDVKLAESKIN